MMLYRLFPRDRHEELLPHRAFHAGSDEKAMDLARWMLSAGQGELWCGLRLVAIMYPVWGQPNEPQTKAQPIGAG